MPTYRVPVVGPIDENTDLWELFQRDARGGFGFHYGELFVELAKAAHPLLPELNSIIRRGLRSSDANERASALYGAYQLNPERLGDDLEQFANAHLGEASSRVFLDVLGAQPPSDAGAKRALALVRQATLPADAQGALARAIAHLEPSLAVSELIAALDPLDRDKAHHLLRALAVSPSFDDVVKQLSQRSAEVRRACVAVGYEAMSADQSPDAYDRWLQTAESLSAAPANPPARPAETEEMRRFNEKMQAMIAAQEAPATLPPQGPVVLSSEVWVDALRALDGPPAELFTGLQDLSVPILTSEALIRTVLRTLTDLGWDAQRLRCADERIRSTSTVRSADDSAGESPEITLAKLAGVRAVYSVGPRTGQILHTITFRPVHELLSSLRT